MGDVNTENYLGHVDIELSEIISDSTISRIERTPISVAIELADDATRNMGRFVIRQLVLTPFTLSGPIAYHEDEQSSGNMVNTSGSSGGHQFLENHADTLAAHVAHPFADSYAGDYGGNGTPPLTAQTSPSGRMQSAIQIGRAPLAASPRDASASATYEAAAKEVARLGVQRAAAHAAHDAVAREAAAMSAQRSASHSAHDRAAHEAAHAAVARAAAHAAHTAAAHDAAISAALRAASPSPASPLSGGGEGGATSSAPMWKQLIPSLSANPAYAGPPAGATSAYLQTSAAHMRSPHRLDISFANPANALGAPSTHDAAHAHFGAPLSSYGITSSSARMTALSAIAAATNASTPRDRLRAPSPLPLPSPEPAPRAAALDSAMSTQTLLGLAGTRAGADNVITGPLLRSALGVTPAYIVGRAGGSGDAETQQQRAPDRAIVTPRSMPSEMWVPSTRDAWSTVSPIARAALDPWQPYPQPQGPQDGVGLRGFADVGVGVAPPPAAAPPPPPAATPAPSTPAAPHAWPFSASIAPPPPPPPASPPKAYNTASSQAAVLTAAREKGIAAATSARRALGSPRCNLNYFREIAALAAADKTGDWLVSRIQEMQSSRARGEQSAPRASAPLVADAARVSTSARAALDALHVAHSRVLRAEIAALSASLAEAKGEESAATRSAAARADASSALSATAAPAGRTVSYANVRTAPTVDLVPMADFLSLEHSAVTARVALALPATALNAVNACATVREMLDAAISGAGGGGAGGVGGGGVADASNSLESSSADLRELDELTSQSMRLGATRAAKRDEAAKLLVELRSLLQAAGSERGSLSSACGDAGAFLADHAHAVARFEGVQWAGADEATLAAVADMQGRSWMSAAGGRPTTGRGRGEASTEQLLALAHAGDDETNGRARRLAAAVTIAQNETVEMMSK